MQKLPKEFIELCQSVKAKRPRTVIDHIIKHGFISTEELQTIYGYDHPPRAIRDVREYGIPIETYRIKRADGKSIAAYKFGEIGKYFFSKIAGRTGLSKKIKEKLIEQYGCKCFIYLEEVNSNMLQIDHRVPYEIGRDGDCDEINSDDFMLLSTSANRAKSWSCEHCDNWTNSKDKKVCFQCYWAYPDNYTHIAMRPIRRIDLIWEGNDVEIYEKLKEKALKLEKEIPLFVKEIIYNEVLRNK